jgi:hypothetical protein
MKSFRLLLALVASAPLFAQTECPPTPTFTPCDIIFELTEQEAAAHPNPYVSVQLEVEFRSPRYRTFLMPAFWDGGQRMVVRFTPTEAGKWDFRVTSNVKSFEGKIGHMEATESNSPGFIRPRNVHHWGYTESDLPHLWMGDTCYRFGFIDRAVFDKVIETRAQQKFNHLRGLVIGGQKEAANVFPNPDQPNIAYFRELDQRILAMNRKGIIADLVLAGDENHLVSLFPTWQQRERYIRYLVARYSAMHITWQGVQEFEEYEDGRSLLKEVGELLKKLDPYDHPRSTHTVATSAPLFGDGWMNYVVYQSSNDQLGAIEHQLYAAPFINAEFAYEDSGAGRTHPHHVDTDTFRKRLWNSTMDGQYPTFGNTGTYGGRNFPVDPKYLDSPGARQMTIWYDFFAQTRHWELEPYFDVDGGRALALERPRGEQIEGVEYIIYVEKPGPVDVLVQKHKYNVAWFNPITGEWTKEKDFKADKYTAQPPDMSHDWVLYIYRQGRKEGLGRSYKFESRATMMQVVEQSPQKVPYQLVEPSAGVLPVGKPVKYAAKITRDTRATRSMMWLWTGEVTADGLGYRVLATGQEGEMKIPARIAKHYPALMNLRLAGMNANGKVYFVDKVYKLTQ